MKVKEWFSRKVMFSNIVDINEFYKTQKIRTKTMQPFQRYEVSKFDFFFKVP